MKTDSHVHSPFCPHGSKDSFVEYIERGIKLGLQEITFTEHAVLHVDTIGSGVTHP